MTRLSVWAPRPTVVEVAVAGRRTSMQRDAAGWWHADVADAGPGTDYGFVLDGREPALPDPRSHWQPTGVHGPSRLVDHAAFRWTDGDFRAPPLPSAVVYELHVGTFSPEGTFDGATGRLDHLVDLGVTHVELMPVNEFPGDRGWGYDGVGLFAPHHAYGGPAGLQRLVDAAHGRGLAVLLDVVYNHLGPTGNYLPQFGPYVTETHTSPWGPAINFDAADSDEVRRFFCDNALHWLREYHIDGLRLDAVHAISDASARHILEQLADEVAALEAASGRSLVLIAESDRNDPRLVRSADAGGFGLDAQWSDDFHHALHAVLTGEAAGYYQDFGRLADVATALRSAFVYGGRYSPHRRRVHGRAPVGVAGWRFLGYLQTHDQIGNRARGERITHLTGLARARVGAALVLTSPFVPMLFQGEEWAASTPFPYFTGHEDPTVADAVRAGRLSEFRAFGWSPHDIPDPQATATFESARLDWAERDRTPHAEMLDWHRRLIALRRAEPDLTDGRLDAVAVEVDESTGVLIVRRGSIVVVANLGPQAAEVPVGAAEPLLVSGEPVVVNGSRVAVSPDSVAILRVASQQAAG